MAPADERAAWPRLRARSSPPPRGSHAAPTPCHPIRLALVGSSGGSTHRGAARSEVGALRAQLTGVCAGRGTLPTSATAVILQSVVYVQSSMPLDMAHPECPASLWVMNHQVAGKGAAASNLSNTMAEQLCCVAQGELSRVNQIAVDADKSLALSIMRGEIHAIILISADVRGTNCSSMAAATQKGIPVCEAHAASDSKTGRMARKPHRTQAAPPRLPHTCM